MQFTSAHGPSPTRRRSIKLIDIDPFNPSGGHICVAVNVFASCKWLFDRSNHPSFCCHFCHYTGSPPCHFCHYTGSHSHPHPALPFSSTITAPPRPPRPPVTSTTDGPTVTLANAAAPHPPTNTEQQHLHRYEHLRSCSRHRRRGQRLHARHRCVTKRSSPSRTNEYRRHPRRQIRMIEETKMEPKSLRTISQQQSKTK